MAGVFNVPMPLLASQPLSKASPRCQIVTTLEVPEPRSVASTLSAPYCNVSRRPASTMPFSCRVVPPWSMLLTNPSAFQLRAMPSGLYVVSPASVASGSRWPPEISLSSYSSACAVKAIPAKQAIARKRPIDSAREGLFEGRGGAGPLELAADRDGEGDLHGLVLVAVDDEGQRARLAG